MKKIMSMLMLAMVVLLALTSAKSPVVPKATQVSRRVLSRGQQVRMYGGIGMSVLGTAVYTYSLGKESSSSYINMALGLALNVSVLIVWAILMAKKRHLIAYPFAFIVAGSVGLVTTLVAIPIRAFIEKISDSSLGLGRVQQGSNGKPIRENAEDRAANLVQKDLPLPLDNTKDTASVTTAAAELLELTDLYLNATDPDAKQKILECMMSASDRILKVLPELKDRAAFFHDLINKEQGLLRKVQNPELKNGNSEAKNDANQPEDEYLAKYWTLEIKEDNAAEAVQDHLRLKTVLPKMNDPVKRMKVLTLFQRRLKQLMAIDGTAKDKLHAWFAPMLIDSPEDIQKTEKLHESMFEDVNEETKESAIKRLQAMQALLDALKDPERHMALLHDAAWLREALLNGKLLEPSTVAWFNKWAYLPANADHVS